MIVFMCSRTMFLFILVTLIGTAATSILTFTQIAEEFFIISFNALYTRKYVDLVETLSLITGKPFPAITGLVTPEVWEETIGAAKNNYMRIGRAYFWLIGGRYGKEFFTFTLPVSLMFIVIGYSILLDTISINKILQVITIIGHRKYYFYLVSQTLLFSLISAILLLLPLNMYMCIECTLLERLIGSLTLVLFLVDILLFEAIVYIISGWNASMGLLGGLGLSITFLFQPHLAVQAASDVRVFFGNPARGEALAQLAIILSWLLTILYIVVDRREKY